MKKTAQMSEREKRLAWRETTNPQRGLDFARARMLVEAFPRGEFADLMWTFAAPFSGIECSDSTLSALIARRVSAVCEMDWEIRIRKGYEKDPAAIRQAKILNDRWEAIDNVREALEHLVMASFRGFSHLERLPNELRVVDQWNVVRDGMRGAWKYNPGADATLRVRYLRKPACRVRHGSGLLHRSRVQAPGRKNRPGQVHLRAPERVRLG